MLTSPLIICPLRFEAAVLRRALTFPGESPNILVTGPGANAITRWADALRAHLSPPIGSPVLLMGVAGSVSNTHRAGSAFVIDEIRAANGERIIPPLRSEDDTPTVITSVDRVVASGEDRVTLAQQSGAHLVDLESEAFAKVATSRGWRWGIIRGVSDDLSTLAPAGMKAWVNARGGTRTLAVLAALARKPSLLRDLRCLHHNSRIALRKAAELIAHMR